MEGVKSLDRSPEGLLGVGGVERSDGGGGNWGDPPRPDWRCGVLVGAWRPITGDPGKWIAGRVGVGGGRSTAGAERTT